MALDDAPPAPSKTYRIGVIDKDGSGYTLRMLAVAPGQTTTQATGELGVSPGGMLIWVFAKPSNRPLRFSGEAMAVLGQPQELNVAGEDGSAKGRMWVLINSVPLASTERKRYAYTIEVGTTKNADPTDPADWVPVKGAKQAEGAKRATAEKRAPGSTGEIKMPP